MSSKRSASSMYGTPVKRQRMYGPGNVSIAARARYQRRPRYVGRYRALNAVMPRHEVKVVDVPLASYTLNTTGQFTALNVPVQGSAFYNRIGTKLAMKTLHVNYTLQPLNINSVPDYCRVMVVYDRQTNAAFPTMSALLTDYSSSGGTTSNSYSGINMTNRERFLVLMDERLELPATEASGAVSSSAACIDPVSTTFKINRFIKLKDLSTMFNQTNGGTVADIQTGGLYLFTLGSFASGSDGWQLRGSARLKYDDV